MAKRQPAKRPSATVRSVQASDIRKGDALVFGGAHGERRKIVWDIDRQEEGWTKGNARLVVHVDEGSFSLFLREQSEVRVER